MSIRKGTRVRLTLPRAGHAAGTVGVVVHRYRGSDWAGGWYAARVLFEGGHADCFADELEAA